MSLEGVICCYFFIFSGVEWVRVFVINVISWEFFINFFLVCLDLVFVFYSVVVSSIVGSMELLVIWWLGFGELWEYVVDWIWDGDFLEKFNWVWFFFGNFSVLLLGNFIVGVFYWIIVIVVFVLGLVFVFFIWGFREELVFLVGLMFWWF